MSGFHDLFKKSNEDNAPTEVWVTHQAINADDATRQFLLSVDDKPWPADYGAPITTWAANTRYVLASSTPDPAQIRADALREAIWAAFIAGVGQGSDEATSYEWGTAPQQSRQQAFNDFMADWNEDSAYLRALLATPPSPPADPAQIRADALREAASVASKYNKNSTIGAVTSWAITRAIIALIDAPLSPPAVDNSPAPDAGGKESV